MLKKALVKGEFSRLSPVSLLADFCLLFTLNLHVCTYFLSYFFSLFDFFSSLDTEFGARTHSPEIRSRMLF